MTQQPHDTSMQISGIHTTITLRMDIPSMDYSMSIGVDTSMNCMMMMQG